MATVSQGPDVGILERVGDSLTSVSEGFVGFLTRLLGSSNENYVRKLGYVRSRDKMSYTVTPGSLLAQVTELEPKMQALSEAELKELTPKCRERLRQGASLEDLLPEAFAACREAAF